MTVVQSEIRAGAYYDSVVLMQLQKALAGLPGVLDAGVVMATPANLELLEASGLLTPEAKTAKADDLLIVVKGEDDAAATHALSQVNELLQRRRATTSQTFRPKSLAAAAKQLPQAQWVLISVPGRFAAGVARDALDLGKHVFLYSDNVTLTDEIQLKQTARDKGLLVMGPDCGTAIINGVGLGFANRVRRGRIGLVAASGTGLAGGQHAHPQPGRGHLPGVRHRRPRPQSRRWGDHHPPGATVPGPRPRHRGDCAHLQTPCAPSRDRIGRGRATDQQTRHHQLHRLPTPRPAVGQCAVCHDVGGSGGTGDRD